MLQNGAWNLRHLTGFVSFQVFLTVDYEKDSYENPKSRSDLLVVSLTTAEVSSWGGPLAALLHSAH